MDSLYHASLLKIIPPNLARDPQVLAMIEALDEELRPASLATREAMIYARVDELPERVLNVLGWCLHSDFWDDRLGIEAKRYQVKNSILMHMKKGTRSAIEMGLRMVGCEAEISAWHEYGGEEPYHFRIDALVRDETTAALMDDEVVALVREAIEHAKSARDVLDALRLGILLEDFVYRANADLLEELILDDLFVFSDAVDWPTLRAGPEHTAGWPLVASPVVTAGRHNVSGGYLYGSLLCGDSREDFSVLGLALTPFAEDARGATQKAGLAIAGWGDFAGPFNSAVDGGLGVSVCRVWRAGDHHALRSGWRAGPHLGAGPWLASDGGCYRAGGTVFETFAVEGERLPEPSVCRVSMADMYDELLLSAEANFADVAPVPADGGFSTMAARVMRSGDSARAKDGLMAGVKLKAGGGLICGGGRINCGQIIEHIAHE